MHEARMGCYICRYVLSSSTLVYSERQLLFIVVDSVVKSYLVTYMEHTIKCKLEETCDNLQAMFVAVIGHIRIAVRNPNRQQVVEYAHHSVRPPIPGTSLIIHMSLRTQSSSSSTITIRKQWKEKQGVRTEDLHIQRVG